LMVMYGSSKRSLINTASKAKEFHHFWKSLINFIKKRSFCYCWRTVTFVRKKSRKMRWKEWNAFTVQHKFMNNAHKVWNSVPVNLKAFSLKGYLKKTYYWDHTKLL
jgi:hypothetical protein